MKCYVSQYAGLCFGASQAVEEAYKHQKLYGKLWMYGEVLHNPTIMSNLVSLGCKVTNSVDEIPENTMALIRAHGVPPSIHEKLISKNVKIIDKTCPNVKKIHDIVHMDYPVKTKILIFGDSAHPEIQGICGWCSSKPMTLSGKEEYLIHAHELKKYDNLVVVFQTTFDVCSYREIKNLLLMNHSNIEIYNTICSDVSLRQEEISKMARKCDLILIIGGKNSSNTNKLYLIASEHCETIYIENTEEFDINLMKNHNYIGIFNGASTPLASIEEIIKKMQTIDKNVKICRHKFEER